MRNNRKYDDKLNVLGSKIRYYRESNNMTLNDVSNKLMLLGVDIPKNSLQRLEQGNRIIKDYELGTIAMILKVSIDELMSDFIKDLK